MTVAVGFNRRKGFEDARAPRSDTMNITELIDESRITIWNHRVCAFTDRCELIFRGRIATILTVAVVLQPTVEIG